MQLIRPVARAQRPLRINGYDIIAGISCQLLDQLVKLFENAANDLLSYGEIGRIGILHPSPRHQRWEQPRPDPAHPDVRRSGKVVGVHENRHMIADKIPRRHEVQIRRPHDPHNVVQRLLVQRLRWIAPDGFGVVEP